MTSMTNAAIDQAGRATRVAPLIQLERYMTRAWAGAGIPPGRRDDCSQAVYEGILADLGRDGLDAIIDDVGRAGVGGLVEARTPRGMAFLRVLDRVKKRARRERRPDPLGGGEAAPTVADGGAALRELIEVRLAPRHAGLLLAVLAGKTPAEIAAARGVSAKTVSNEKSHALRAARAALAVN